MASSFKTPLTVEAIRDSELYPILLKIGGQPEPLSESVIAQKLRAAEDFYERALEVRFSESRVVSDPGGRGLAADTYDVEIPAFNFPECHTFGYTELPYRPIRAVTQAFFAYPGAPAIQPGFVVPNPWIRLDRRFGKLYFVPAGALALNAAKMSGLIMSAIAYGQRIPMCFFVDYTCGFTSAELRHDHNDLLEAIRLRAALLILGIASAIRNRGLGSQSLSEDGLSQSQSFITQKYGPYSGTVELWMKAEADLVQNWQRQERGIPFGVLGAVA